jgi:hypothetical protein
LDEKIMEFNPLNVMKKCIALLILCTLGAVSNAVFAGSTEEKATPLTIEHSAAKPNKPLLRRAKIILDKALVQLSGGSDGGLGCTFVSSFVSKEELAAFVLTRRVRIAYLRSDQRPELQQNSLLFELTGYEITESRKKRPVVLLVSVHYENGSCAELSLRIPYDEPWNKSRAKPNSK